MLEGNVLVYASEQEGNAFNLHVFHLLMKPLAFKTG